MKSILARTGHEKDTCTACAGTMILEFAALSRLTGNMIYEASNKLHSSELHQVDLNVTKFFMVCHVIRITLLPSLPERSANVMHLGVYVCLDALPCYLCV